MMGSNDKPQDELLYAFNLDEIVPQDHLLRDIDRNGESRAAIALANNNVRTAWAMVTQGTEYQRRQQLEMAA